MASVRQQAADAAASYARDKARSAAEVSFADFELLKSQAQAAVEQARAHAAAVGALRERELPALAARLEEVAEGVKKGGEPRDMDTLFHERINGLEGALGARVRGCGCGHACACTRCCCWCRCMSSTVGWPVFGCQDVVEQAAAPWINTALPGPRSGSAAPRVRACSPWQSGPQLASMRCVRNLHCSFTPCGRRPADRGADHPGVNVVGGSQGGGR